MIKNRFIRLFILGSLAFFSCKNSGTNDNAQTPLSDEKATEPAKSTSLAFDPATVAEEPVFDIVTSEGSIRIKLYKETPLHRDNFVKLASERFFDDILFHRVINHFMIQVGDPLTKDPNASAAAYGTGGPGYTIPAEILPQFKHKKGALAAARKSDAANPNRESSGSQFYLVHDADACAQLDGSYSVFGETVSGIEVIDKIAQMPVSGAKNLPTTPIKIISVNLVTE